MSLRGRIDALEQQFGDAEAVHQLRLFGAAIRGDAAAAFKLDVLRAAGKGLPFLTNLWDLYRRGPVGRETEKREESIQ
ncbi:MAG TPA: hypothetical protein VG096_06170 [Bryobacteraceae bacterium]|jgi:hypothetical protein|nr:hypothetical protein [Bryobacteraceae bacterium]